MFDFHEKRKIRAVLYSKPFVGLLLVGAIMLSTSVYDRYLVSQEIRGKLEDRHRELEALEARADALEQKVQYLKDNRGVEEEIRNRFDVAKEGEQVVILLGETEEVVTTTESVSSDTQKTKQGAGVLDALLFWR